MAFRPIRHGRRSAAGVPLVQSLPYANGQTFKQGATLVWGAGTGTVTETGADPQSICAIAAEAADSKPGYGAANSPSVVTGRVQEVSAFILDREEIFAIDGSADGTALYTPLVGDLGKLYGLAKDANGTWYLDTTETTTTSVIVVDIDVDTKAMYVKFKSAVIQLAG